MSAWPSALKAGVREPVLTNQRFIHGVSVRVAVCGDATVGSVMVNHESATTRHCPDYRLALPLD